jgi:hypothetical protein
LYIKNITLMKGAEMKFLNESERWLDITGFNGKYQVSNLGRIKGPYGLRKFSKTRDGYHRIVLYLTQNKKCTINLHKIVAGLFIPNPNNKPSINHINGIKTDNRMVNLEWVTPKENTQHAIKLGLISIDPSIRRTSAKLSKGNVLEIFNSQERQIDLAKKFDVSKMTINDIKTGRCWSDVTGKYFYRMYPVQ